MFTRGQRNCNLCNCHAMHSQTCTTFMLLLFRASQSDLLTYPGLSRISSYTLALSRICSHTRALSRISSHTLALSRISSHTRALSRISSHTQALSRISSHTRALSRISSHTQALSRISSHTRALSRISSHTEALSRISLHIQAPESDLFTYPGPESDLLTYPALSRISLHTRALSRISSHIRAPAHAKEAYSSHGTASFNLSTQSYLPSRIQSRIIDSRWHSRKQSPLGKPSCRSVWGALTTGVSPSGRDNTARQQPIWMHPPFRSKTPQIYSLSFCQSPVLNTTRLSISSEPDPGATESVNNCNKYQPLGKAFEFSYSLGSKALSNKIDPQNSSRRFLVDGQIVKTSTLVKNDQIRSHTWKRLQQ